MSKPENQPALPGQWRPEYMPDFTLDRQIAEAREQMGEQRWLKLMAEWDETENEK